MLCKFILTQIMEHIQDALHSNEFLERFKEPKRFVRKRLLSMYQVIFYLLYSNRASMSINLGNIRENLPSLNFPKISKQAVSKARQHIKPELFQALFDITVNDYYSYKHKYHLWNGYHLFAVDGSQIHMAYSKSVEETYGSQGDSRYEKRHYMGQGSVLYDISQDIIIDAQIEHCLFSERKLAKQHLQKLKGMNISHNALIIFDRGYYSADLYNYIISLGFHCLMRIKKQYTSLIQEKSDDEFIDHPKLNGTVRTIKVLLSSGETEYLVTDIIDPAFTPEIFGELYFRRWKIESKYYELKEQWELEKFNGATSRAVEQEYYMFMMKSNYCAILKNEADKTIQEKTRSENLYQCCRAHLIGRISVLFPKYLLGEPVATSLEDLFQEAVRNKSMICNGRKFKRKKPRNQKKHCKNRKTTT